MAATRQTPDVVVIQRAYAAFVEVLRISCREESREPLLRVLLRRVATQYGSNQAPDYDQLSQASRSNLERLFLLLIDAVKPPPRGRHGRRRNLTEHLIWCAPDFTFLVGLVHEAMLCEPPLREAMAALDRQHQELVVRRAS